MPAAAAPKRSAATPARMRPEVERTPPTVSIAEASSAEKPRSRKYSACCIVARLATSGGVMNERQEHPERGRHDDAAHGDLRRVRPRSPGGRHQTHRQDPPDGGNEQQQHDDVPDKGAAPAGLRDQHLGGQGRQKARHRARERDAVGEPAPAHVGVGEERRLRHHARQPDADAAEASDHGHEPGQGRRQRSERQPQGHREDPRDHHPPRVVAATR